MKQVLCLTVVLFLLAFSMVANGAETIEKYWERGCGVDNTSDDARNMGVWAGGDILATVNRQSGSDAIKLFNATTGLEEELVGQLDMTGIPSALYSICAGDFSDDGAFFAASLSYTTGADLFVYYWADISAAPVQVYAASYSTRLGDALDVRGSVSDNSVSILIAGNTATSVPVKITYDGSSWSGSFLANALQATDLHQTSDGKFVATFPAGDIVKIQC